MDFVALLEIKSRELGYVVSRCERVDYWYETTLTKDGFEPLTFWVEIRSDKAVVWSEPPSQDRTPVVLEHWTIPDVLAVALASHVSI